MIAEPTTTSAAPSTSAAPAPASQAPAPQEAEPGNNGESSHFPDAADIASALGLPPEGQTTESAPSADADPELEQVAAAIADGQPVPEAEAEPAPESEAGQPTEEAAAPGEAASAAGAKIETTEPKVPEGFQRRIDELTAARRGAEERVAQLEQQVSALTARDAGRYEPDVLEAVDDPATLEKQRSQWQSLHTWAARHLNAPEAKLPGTDKTMTPEEVANLFASTSTLLNEAAPRRAAFLQERARLDAATNQVYPWASDTKEGLGAALHQGLKELPELRRLPNGRVIAADALIGQALRNTGVRVDDALLKRLAAEAKRAPAPAAGTPRPGATAAQPPRRTPPAAPGRPGTVPARTSATDIARKRAQERMVRERGSVQSVADAILAGM